MIIFHQLIVESNLDKENVLLNSQKHKQLELKYQCKPFDINRFIVSFHIDEVERMICE